MPNDAISRNLKTFISNNTPGGYIQSTVTISDSDIDQKIQEKITNFGFLTESLANNKYQLKINLSPVATSGSYTDLNNTPILSPVATSGSYTDLNNTPILSPVATSGNYADLENKPIFSRVATSGSYIDLENLPQLELNVFDLSQSIISFDEDFILSINDFLFLEDPSSQTISEVFEDVIIPPISDSFKFFYFLIDNKKYLVYNYEKYNDNVHFFSLLLSSMIDYNSINQIEMEDEEILSQIELNSSFSLLIYDANLEKLIFKK